MKRAAMLLLLALLAAFAGALWFLLDSLPERRVAAPETSANGAGDLAPPRSDAAAGDPLKGKGLAQRAKESRGPEPAAGERDSTAAAESSATAADPLRAVTFHVVDRATGRELIDVEIAAGVLPEPAGAPLAEPRALLDRDDLPLLARGSSPLRVEPPAVPPARVRVAARGFEPCVRGIDWRGGGERTLALQPAGALEVQLLGAPPEGEFVASAVPLDALERSLAQELATAQRFARPGPLSTDAHRALLERRRARALADSPAASPVESLRRDGSPHAERLARRRALDAQRRALFEGLSPDRWHVVVRAADGSAVAAGEATLQPGDRAVASLRYAAPVATEDAPLVGRVVLDPAWLAVDRAEWPTRMTIRYLAPEQRSRHGGADGVGARLTAIEPPGTFTFDAGRLPLDGALAWFPEWSYAVALPSLEIAIPPPTEVEATIVDAAGEPQPDLHVGWCGADRAEALSPWVERARATSDAAGRVRFRVPQGVLLIAASRFAPQLFRVGATFEAREPTLRLELRARESSGVTLTLRDAGGMVPWSDEWHVEARPLRADCRWIGEERSEMHFSNTLWFEGDGAVEIALTGLAGYAPIAPFPIELSSGAVGDVTVELRRLD
ncbi:MAG: hypothetical protein JNL90_00605 [Planctomycetes bacterium]|nr:hypothetical protein [Planctomycetota bacterium]